MLWSQFSAFFANFRWKHWHFSQKQCYYHNFLRFLPIFGEDIGIFDTNQCYDHNFLRFLPNFWCRQGHFSQKTNVTYDQIFAKLAVVFSKSALLSPNFFRENILKIIASVPGKHSSGKCVPFKHRSRSLWTSSLVVQLLMARGQSYKQNIFENCKFNRQKRLYNSTKPRVT
jgi:hypothetical protein